MDGASLTLKRSASNPAASGRGVLDVDDGVVEGDEHGGVAVAEVVQCWPGVSGLSRPCWNLPAGRRRLNQATAQERPSCDHGGWARVQPGGLQEFVLNLPLTQLLSSA